MTKVDSRFIPRPFHRIATFILAALLIVIGNVFAAEAHAVEDDSPSNVTFFIEGDGEAQITPSAVGYKPFTLTAADNGKTFTFPSHTALSCRFVSDSDTYTKSEHDGFMYYDVLEGDYRDFTLLPGDISTSVSFGKELSSPESNAPSLWYLLTAGGRSMYQTALASSTAPPEEGDTYPFTGSVKILATSEGGGVQAASMTVSTPLAFKGTYSADCYDHGAAASGGSCSGTITIKSVNKTTGTVTASILAEHIAGLPMHWETGAWANGYPADYQRFLANGVFHFDYNGYLSLNKKSSDTDITEGNSNYSLANAVYGVYADRDCTDRKKTMKTNSRGEAGPIELPSGIYYVKEITAPKGYKLDPRVYRANVKGTTEDDPVLVTSTDRPRFGKIKLKKSSAKPDWTWDESFYSLAGAEYEVRDSSGKVAATLVTDHNGNATSGNLPLGRYTVKETAPPKGYRLDQTPHAVSLFDNGDEDTPIEALLQVSDEPERGKISVQKKPGNLITLNLNTYSLAGAKYQIIDDKGKIWETLTTDSIGKAKSMDLPLGHYTVKETVAPQGYDVNITPDKVTVTEDKEDHPVNARDYESPTSEEPFATKQDVNIEAIGSPSGVQGAAELVNATYQLTYYDGYYTSFDQIKSLTPKKTSTIKTKLAQGANKGTVTITPEQANMEYNGRKWFLPLGTYKLQEISAPEGYHLDVNSYLFQVRYDSQRKPQLYLMPTSNNVKTTSNINEPLGEHNLIITRDAVKRGDLSINKYIEDTTDPDKYPDKKRPAAGVKFHIINNNDYAVLNVQSGKAIPKGGIVYTLTTDEQGYASTRLEMTEFGQTGIVNNNDPTRQSPNALAYGNYIIEEDPATTPEGYIPIKNYHVSIGENFQYKHVIFENKTGTVVRLNKVDDGTRLNVRGMTKFQILDENKEPMTFTEPYPSNAQISILTTDIDGSAIIPEKLLKGTYYIKEIEAAEGYLHSDALIPFQIDSSTVNDYGHPHDVYFEDAAARGKLVLTKRDTTTDGVITSAPATYEIYANEDIVTQDGTVRAHKDELVDTITTVNGVATSKQLYIGSYRAVEVQAPTGYLLDTQPINFEITYGGDMNGVADKDTYTRVDAYDEPVYGAISVTKLDAETNSPVLASGISFTVRAAENIVGGDGHIWHAKGATVAKIETDERGIASTDTTLRLGKYEVVETSAPYGYVLDSTPVPIEIEYVNQHTPIVTATGTKSDKASNTDFRIAKLDRETFKSVWVPGCEIGIYAAENIMRGDGSVWATANQFIGSATTDESGYAVSDLNLLCGKYYFKELRAPNGYVLDKDRVYNIEATWDGGVNEHQILAASISDIPSKGVITFTKADAETGKSIPVAGIRAEVYANEDIVTGDGTVRAHKDDLVASLVTDEAGFAQTGELYLGSYRVIETFAPEGYLINETPVDIELLYEDQNIPVIFTASQIKDENAKGIIEINKIDRETGNVIPLAGTTFEIRAKDDIVTPDGTVRVKAGELACEPVSTDATGKCSTPPLYIGIYSIIETKAPEGYVLDSTPHDAIVAYKDQHTPITLASSSVDNVAQKGVVEITKIDEESGLTVLTAGAQFEIRAKDDIVTADGTKRASAGEVVDVAETDSNGLAVSKALYLGKYEIKEIKAPHGYLLTDEVREVTLEYGDPSQPIVFDMESIADKAVKGKISIHKADSVTSEPLSGVVYEIRAAEDIVTGDGMEHHKAGDVIATLTTDANGSAESGELHLGKYLVVETSQPDGYVLDKEDHQIELEYEDQNTPIVIDEANLYNEPTTVTVKKVSTDNPDMVVEGTKFVGWKAADESDSKSPFAVFISDKLEIKGATVNFLGAFDNAADGDSQAREFSLTKTDAKGYALYTSNETLSEGNYALHISYADNGVEKSTDMPFSVNEYDTSAVFAVGSDLVGSGSGANSFANIKASETAADPNIEDEVSSEGEEGSEFGTEPEGDASTQTENYDEPSGGEGDPNEDNPGSADAPDAPVTPDDNSEKPDFEVYRVPVILSQGSFALAETNADGLASFIYVNQGRAGFAEYQPAEGFVSDRSAAYADISADSTVTETSASGNITAGRASTLDFTFADDQTKLHVSKKDITSNEELPGNVLSVYEYVDTGDGESDIASDNYGKLVETWVSQEEPHYMELLPQGTYILKEEQAVDGYTIAESIKFHLNDTGVAQQVVMHNERAAGVADELIEENPLPLADLLLTGDMPFRLLLLGTLMISSIAGVVFIRWSRERR